MKLLPANNCFPIFPAKVALPVLTLFSALSLASAATIDFESPIYVPGNLAGAITTPAPFDGQDGWSRGVSSGVGGIVATANSGEYVGGQALRSSPSANDSYIGGRALSGLSGLTQISYDYQLSNVGRSYLGLWDDVNSDGLLTSGEAGLVFGANNLAFQIRLGNGGTEFSSGVSGTLGNWYRLTLDLGVSSGGNRTVAMSAYNLTTSALVDLDTASAATAKSWTLTDAQFGVVPENAEGLWIRLGSNAGGGVVDNIVTVVPEPSTFALALTGLVFGVARRIRR